MWAGAGPMLEATPQGVTQMSDEPVKCRVDFGKLTPCAFLEKVTESQGGMGTRRQGLKWYTVIHSDMKRTRDIIACIGGESPRGLTIEFCPYCGENIRTRYSDD